MPQAVWPARRSRGALGRSPRAFGGQTQPGPLSQSLFPTRREKKSVAPSLITRMFQASKNEKRKMDVDGLAEGKGRRAALGSVGAGRGGELSEHALATSTK